MMFISLCLMFLFSISSGEFHEVSLDETVKFTVHDSINIGSLEACSMVFYTAVIEYIASPSLDDKTLILVDPMLATGSSMELAYRALLTKGTPKEIHLVSIIASQEAVDYLQKQFPESNIHLWVAAIDPTLNEMAYIVPGLGDAGDLAYGTKL